MENQQLQKWALIAEVIGGLAVVVSLGVVAFELNQSTEQQELNTSALEIAAYQELINSIIEINTLSITVPELRQAVLISQDDLGSVSENDRRILDNHYMNVIRHGDMAYFQFQRGIIDESRLNSALAILLSMLRNNPIAVERWERAKGALEPAYVEYVERTL